MQVHDAERLDRRTKGRLDRVRPSEDVRGVEGLGTPVVPPRLARRSSRVGVAPRVGHRHGPGVVPDYVHHDQVPGGVRAGERQAGRRTAPHLGVPTLHEMGGGTRSDVEGGRGGRAVRGRARGRQRVAGTSRVDGETREGGDARGHRDGRAATESPTGGVGPDGQAHLRGVVRGLDVAVGVLDRHLHRRGDDRTGGGVGGALDEGQLGRWADLVHRERVEVACHVAFVQRAVGDRRRTPERACAGVGEQ